MAIKGQQLHATYLAWNTATNSGQEGDGANHSLELVRDGVETSIANAVTEFGSGTYGVLLTASQMDANTVVLQGSSSTGNVVLHPVIIVTDQGRLKEILQLESSSSSSSSASLSFSSSSSSESDSCSSSSSSSSESISSSSSSESASLSQSSSSFSESASLSSSSSSSESTSSSSSRSSESASLSQSSSSSTSLSSSSSSSSSSESGSNSQSSSSESLSSSSSSSSGSSSESLSFSSSSCSSSSSSSSESESFSSSSSSGSDSFSSSSSSSSFSSSESTSLSSSSSSTGPFSPDDLGGLSAWMDTGGSVPRHVVTDNGNAQLDTAQKKFGAASGLFNSGTSDYLTIPDSADWTFGSDNFTIECWVRLGDLLNRTIVTQREDDTHRWAVEFHNTQGLYFFFNNGSGYVIMDQGSVVGWSTDTWYHVAVVRNGTSFKGYRNGVEIASLTDATAITDYSSELYIGQKGNGNQYFDGHIDEFRISTTARYTSGFTPSVTPFTRDDDTVLLLHFDGSDASTRFVDSARPDDGAAISIWTASSVETDASQSTEADQPTYDRNSVAGSDAVKFDGVSDNLNWGKPAALDFMRTSDYTIFAVITSGPHGTYGNVVQRGDNYGAGEDEFFAIYQRGSDGKITSQFRGSNGGANTQSVTSTDALSEGSTSYFVAIKEDSQHRLWRDGVLQGTDTNTPGTITSTTHNNRIGCGEDKLGATELFFNGWIAELIVYDSALSDSDRALVETYLDEKYNDLPSSSSSSESNSSSSSSSSSSESTSLSSSSSSESLSFSSSSSSE